MSGILARIADFFASRTSTSRTRQTAPQRAAFEKEAELADLPTATEAERLVLQICQEIVAVQGDRYERIKLTASAAWESFKTAPAPLQIAAAKVAIIDLQPSGSYASTTQSWMVSEARRAIASQLLRRDLPLTQDDLANFVQQWCGQQYSLEYGFPGNALLGAAERILGGRNPEPALRTALQTLQRHSLFHRPGQTQTQSEVALLARIKAILNPAEASHIRLPNGVFGDSVQALLATLPSDQCEAWLALLIHAAKDSDKSKPSGKWLTAARPLVAAVTPAAFFEQLIRLMAATTPDPARPDISLDILKGLIWLSVRVLASFWCGSTPDEVHNAVVYSRQ